MNKGDKNIDQLFKDAFESFEPNVSDGVWSKVSNHISGSQLGAVTGTMGTWSIVTVAVVCGIAGASIAWIFQDQKHEPEEKNNQEINIDESNKMNSENKKIPLKEVIFTESFPVDKQDPLVFENDKENKEFEIHIKDNKDIEEVNKNKSSKPRYQPASIVNLFLTPRTKILNNKKHENELKSSHDQHSSTQVEITEVIKSKLNPIIKTSVSGGYVPLIVSFQQTEQASEVSWDLGDGTTLNGTYVEHIFREPKEYKVVVIIKDQYGREATATKIISVKSRCIITNVPNIFTPNGDGENDLFYVQGENIKSFFIQIFNIEGKVIFETNYMDAKWDGTDALGQQLSSGQYLYFIKAIGEDGTDLSKTGTLTLKR